MTHSLLPKLGALAVVSMLSLQAQEVTYQQAAKELELETWHRPQVTIWTKDGQKLPGTRWKVDSEGASLQQKTSLFSFSSQPKMRIPKSQIGRIESRDFGRFSSKLFMVAGALKSDLAKQWQGNKSVGLKLLVTLPSAPLWAYFAAATPVHLAADGVAAFVPKKEFKFVQ